MTRAGRDWRPGPHDDLVWDLHHLSKGQGWDSWPNTTIEPATDRRSGRGHRRVDILLSRGDTTVIVEVKTDLTWAYLRRRAAAQVGSYGDVIEGRGRPRPHLIVVAHEVTPEIIDDVHIIPASNFLATLDCICPFWLAEQQILTAQARTWERRAVRDWIAGSTAGYLTCRGFAHRDRVAAANLDRSAA